MEKEHKDLLAKHGYVGGELIGKGSFGKVYRCTNIKRSGLGIQAFAVKIIGLGQFLGNGVRSENDLGSQRLNKLVREIDVMKSLHHPCIVRLHKVFRTDTAFYLIMELVVGLDLYEMIVARQGLKDNEREAVHMYAQVCSAIAYMHGKGIVHRDVKPENIIVQAGAGNVDEGGFSHAPVKLIDFGLSKVIEDVSNMGDSTDSEAVSLKGSEAKSLVGTPRYVAPEILAETLKRRMKIPSNNSKSSEFSGKQLSTKARTAYGKEVDCYSMGVLLHVMLGACFPQFDSNNVVVFKDARIREVSSDAKELIRGLLEFNPQKRFTMKDALNHPWIQKNITFELQHILSLEPDLDPMLRHKQHRGSQSKNKEENILSFEEFQKKIFEKLDRTSSSGSMSDVSVESMNVSEPIIQALQEQNQAHTNEDNITGMKRQASTAINQNNISVSDSNGTGVRLQSRTSGSLLSDGSNGKVVAVAIQNSGSQSSIENIDLPGAKAGVWGPFRQQETSYAESFRKATTPPKEFDFQFDFSQNQSRYSTENMSNAENDSVANTTTDINKKQDTLLVRKDGADSGNRNRSNISSHEVSHFGTLEDPDLLLGLQAEISGCLKVAFDHFGDDKNVAPGIIASSVGSRELMRSTETIIKKLEQTSASVIGILPDIQMAVEEGEFGMATAFFQTIKDWIQGLKTEAQTLLEKNVRVIASVNNTMLLAREAGQEERRELSRRKLKKEREINEHESTGGADAQTLLDAINGAIRRGEEVDMKKVTEMLQSVNGKTENSNFQSMKGEDPNDLRNLAVVAVQKQRSLEDIKINENDNEAALVDLSRALSTLQKVDKLLQQHASFWSHMEVVIQVLMQRANHVESMTHFTKNPRLRGRFFQRLTEYAETWNKVERMCERFQARARNVTPRLFNFLTDDLDKYKKPDF